MLNAKKLYDQKFRRQWLQDEALKGWIRTIPGDETKGRCKFCKIEIKAKYQDLKRHAKSKKHISTTPSSTPTPIKIERSFSSPSSACLTPNSRMYKQKFRKQWLQDDLLKDWIKGVPGDDSKARCKHCRTEVKAKYQDLKMHAASKKHLKAMPSVFGPLKPQPAHLEGSMAMNLCCHSEVTYIDHLVELCRNNLRNCETVTNMKITRMKCTDIVKNILCNHFEKELINDIGNSKYSLLLEDSYISNMKLFGVCVVYFSRKNNKVVTVYFGLVKFEKYAAETIAQEIKQLLVNKKLDLKNLVGIGTDNASFAVEIDNEIHAKLKEDAPSLILIRCVSLSLQFAISHTATECLPMNLEFLVSETHKWFLKSNLRQNMYKNLFEALGDGHGPVKGPANDKTQWLSIQPAVEKVIQLWTELGQHFELTRQTERCYTAEILFSMYSDEKNLAYLLFLQPILVEVQKVKELFRSKNVDKIQLLDDLLLLIGTIGGKIALPPCEIDLLTCDINAYLNPKPHLGDSFEAKLDELRNRYIVTINDENILRSQCQNFLLSLFEQLKLRLLDEVTHLQNLSLFSAKNILQPTKDITSFCEVMKYLGASEESIAEAEYQLTKIIVVDWKNKTDTEAFWKEVIQYKDTSGCSSFQELGECAVSALVLLHSNAEIKRLISSMDYVKAKVNDEIDLGLLNAIMMVKFSLARLGKCCDSYRLPQEVIGTIGGKTPDSVTSFKLSPSSPVEVVDVDNENEENEDDADILSSSL